MKICFTKKRAVNSYREFAGDFGDKTTLNIDVNWYIDSKLVLSTKIEAPILDSKIEWALVGSSIDLETREFFNKALKVLAFG